jgi:hypothetical protein
MGKLGEQLSAAKATMKRFLKISALVLLVLMLALAGGGLYVWRGIKAVPEFYQVLPLEGAARLEAIESVEKKVLNLQADLDRAYAHSRASQPTTAQAAPSSDEAAPIVVSFSGPEIDTYFRKWLSEAGHATRIQRYMQNPRIGVADGQVVLAGRMPDFDAVVSLHFLPVSDDKGVQLRLQGVYAGRIRLPDMALEKFRNLSVEALGERLPELRSQAEISPEGFANEAAILASSQTQLINLLQGRAIEPLYTFVPLPGRGLAPSRISEMAVVEDELVVGVELLDTAGSQELLEQIRRGGKPPQGR